MSHVIEDIFHRLPHLIVQFQFAKHGITVKMAPLILFYATDMETTAEGWARNFVERLEENEFMGFAHARRQHMSFGSRGES